MEDKCRAFKCQQSHTSGSPCDGVIHARGPSATDDSEFAPFEWRCSKCSRVIDEAEKTVLMKQEKRMKVILAPLIDDDNDEKSMDADGDDSDCDDDEMADEDDIDDDNLVIGLEHVEPLELDGTIDGAITLINKLSPFRPAPANAGRSSITVYHRLAQSHYLLFHCYDRILRTIASASGFATDAYQLAHHLVDQCLSQVVDSDSEELLTYIDLLGQCCIASGHITDAQRHYQRAAALSEQLLGAESMDCRLYSQLSKQTPSTAKALEAVMTSVQWR